MDSLEKKNRLNQLDLKSLKKWCEKGQQKKLTSKLILKKY